MNSVKLEIEELLVTGELNDYERSLLSRIIQFIEQLQDLLKDYKSALDFKEGQTSNIAYSYTCCSNRLSEAMEENTKLKQENEALKLEIEKLKSGGKKTDIGFWDYLLNRKEYLRKARFK